MKSLVVLMTCLISIHALAEDDYENALAIGIPNQRQTVGSNLNRLWDSANSIAGAATTFNPFVLGIRSIGIFLLQNDSISNLAPTPIVNQEGTMTSFALKVKQPQCGGKSESTLMMYSHSQFADPGEESTEYTGFSLWPGVKNRMALVSVKAGGSKFGVDGRKMDVRFDSSSRYKTVANPSHNVNYFGSSRKRVGHFRRISRIQSRFRLKTLDLTPSSS
jgi:hypothetical protein